MEITCEMNECPICYENMIQMETLSCGHNICNCCSERWFVRSNTCPMCRTPVRAEVPSVEENDGTNIIDILTSVIRDDDIIPTNDNIIMAINNIFNNIIDEMRDDYVIIPDIDNTNSIMNINNNLIDIIITNVYNSDHYIPNISERDDRIII